MKLQPFISMIFLSLSIGCIFNPSTVDVPSLPPSKIQITYIRNNENQNFSEFYVMDVTCIMNDKVCLGEPELLFRSLKMPTDVQSKPRGLLTDYSWSPDGNQIALISVGDILIGNIAAKEWKNVTNSPDVDEYEPRWSSDGKFIYYRACPRVIEGIYGGHGACRIYGSDLSGSTEMSFLDSINDSIISFDISPDGKRTMFSIYDPLGTGNLLFQANLDGLETDQVTTDNVSENKPSFSPDGQTIAFVRSNNLLHPNATDASDIIVKDLVSGKEKNLTQDLDGFATSPKFSPDGEWIVFYAFNNHLDTNVFLVSLKQEISLQITQGNEETTPSWRRVTNQ